LTFLAVLLIFFIVAVDQITKQIVLGAVGIGGSPIPVIEGFFYITCHRNSGAAWGILQNSRVFFLVLTTVMLVVMIVFLVRAKSTFFLFALAFVIGGALGNYIDRLLVGSVVDFLDFYIFGYNFPTFNAADSSIVLGAALLIICTLRGGVFDAKIPEIPPDGKEDDAPDL
jgi:signal peptidase II